MPEGSLFLNSATHKVRISVCICTFKRPAWLRYLLDQLLDQEIDGKFEYAVTVVDNDAGRSAEEVVRGVAGNSPIQISYHVEPEQNIALARNRALANSTGELIAFIDDDEFPGRDWLLKLYNTLESYQVDGVLGPVLPYFESPPPEWVRRGRFCDRPVHDTGFVIDSSEGRTGNLLLRRKILDGLEPVFRSEFGSGGEDRDLFRRMIARGASFVWCNEAEVHEHVLSIRWNRRFMLKRALLRGKVSLSHSRHFAQIGKSCVAIIGYSLAMPVMLVLGQHVFMKYLIKTCDHAGKLLAFVGLDPVQEKYVLE